MVRLTRDGVWVWIKDHTMGASWLPARLRHPWAGILTGLVLIGVTFVAVPLLQPGFSGVSLRTLLLFLAIVLTAVMWGTGPSLVVTLLGIVVLDHIQWYPHLALNFGSAVLTLEDFLVLAGGVLIGYLAGQNVAAQKHAELMRARSDEERQRLDAVLEVMPAGVARVFSC
jgi:K+-sensing histidine kinase KdpD